MRGSPEWFDRMYNNRALVPDFADHLQRWADESRLARQNTHCLLDLSYGSGPDETLDIFPTAHANAPVLVFIHGGYWRALDKSDHSFIAPAFTDKGVCVVVPNYALCPAVSIADIVMQQSGWRQPTPTGQDPNFPQPQGIQIAPTPALGDTTPTTPMNPQSAFDGEQQGVETLRAD